MKIFLVDKRCSSIIKNNELGYLLKTGRYDNPSGKAGHQEKHIKKIKVLVNF